jgi:hypothetical protein
MTVMELRLQLDEKDLAAARTYAGIDDPVRLLQHVLRSYVHSKASAELRALAGSDPTAEAPPRRRPPDFLNDPDQPKGT